MPRQLSMNPRAIRQRERRARLRAAREDAARNSAAFADAFPLDADARARLAAAAEDAPPPAVAAGGAVPASPARRPAAPPPPRPQDDDEEEEAEVPEEPPEQENEPDRPPPPVIHRRENLGPPNLPNDVNAPTQLLKYHSVLLEMMSHFTGIIHPTNKVFTNAELSIIEPDHIYKWMCYRAFGLEDPGPEDNPYYARSSTLEFWKKAISYFMPRTAAWDDIKEEGNPTKSKKLNNLVKAVKKKEARMCGKEGQADRAFTLDEFIQMLELIGPAATIVNLRHRAMIKFQFHLIARGDDTSHMKKASVRESLTYPGYLTAQLRWSKNVHEEKDCPLQLLMGSMDPRFCVLLGLAIYLEVWHTHGGGRLSQWLFAEGDSRARSTTKKQDKEAEVCKVAYQRATKGVLEGGRFRFAGDKQLGTHSVKKWATTMSRRCGAGKDDVNYRARWKTSKAMQDKYLEIQLDWPDINSGSRLCHRGICFYKEKDNSNVTDEWLSASVTPAIRGSMGDRVAVILAKPLLWACYDATAADLVPPDLRQLIVNRYSLQNRGRTETEYNPVKQIRIIPSNHDGVVHMDEVPDEDTADREGGGFGRGGQEWRNAIYAKICSTQTNVAEIKNHQLAELAEIKRQLRTLTAMVRGLSYAPARRAAGGGGTRRHPPPQGVPEPGKPATLYPHPRTIEAMWDEYQNGIGGRKAARDFTRRERGSCKYKYARRKLIWDTVERLLDRGNDLSTACNKIRRVHGNVSMTRLINAIREDNKSARPNPNLR